MSGKQRFTLHGEELPVIFTHHAKERLRQYQVSVGNAYSMLCDAIIEKTPHRAWKQKRYGGNFNVHYLRFGPYFFTGKEMRDRRSGEPIFLIITMNDQRIFLK